LNFDLIKSLKGCSLVEKSKLGPKIQGCVLQASNGESTKYNFWKNLLAMSGITEGETNVLLKYGW